MSRDEATYAKFLRFFTSRLVQTLVQARLGIKIEHECCGSSNQANWFNVKIDELGEIAAYLRSAVDEYPPKCEAITIEFLLYTTDGIHLPLESWVVSVDDEYKDDEVNVNTDFYHRLGTVLRSAAAAARVTPMYRYFVKKQSQNTFVILYRIYKGTMDADLGKDAKHLSIAVLPSPFGAMNLDLSYRTNMTLPLNEDSRITSEVEKTAESELLPCRASFSDCIPVVGGEIKDAPTLTTPDFRASPSQTPCHSQPRFRIGRSTSSEESMQSQHLSSSLDARDCGYLPPKPVYRRTESFPFEQLLSSSLSPRKRQSTCSEAYSEPIIEHPLPEIDEAVPSTSEAAPQKNSSPENGENDSDDDTSYVKVFGAINDNTANLGQFIKDCRTAPMNLKGFIDDDSNSLVEQLQHFSAQEKEFEEFVSGINSKISEK